jgi:hypothetical protein
MFAANKKRQSLKLEEYPANRLNRPRHDSRDVITLLFGSSASQRRLDGEGASSAIMGRALMTTFY